MGFLSSIIGAAAPIVGSFFGPAGTAIGGAVGGLIGGSKGAQQSGTQTTTQQQQLDPRAAQILYGGDGQQGILSQFQGFLNQPRSPGAAAFGSGVDRFLGDSGQQLLNNQYAANNVLLSSQFNAPTIQGAQAQAAQVQAPSQNAVNLRPAYENFIYGNPAENPYLTRALQSGIDQSGQAFRTQLGDITQNLQRNVLPGIRGGAIASGQFGSSRQGIAEGNALSDFTRQSTNAAQQLGLANIAATTGAQANAFSQGQDRSLSALQGLSGQQYGVASQNAQLQQQTELANAAARQAADQTNVNALLQTRGQNSANLAQGIQGTQNLLGQANTLANQNDQYAINRAQQVSGLLSPYLGLGGSSTSSQPLYTNPTANALGGAGAALGLYNQFAGMGSQPAASNTASNTNPWAFWS